MALNHISIMISMCPVDTYGSFGPHTIKYISMYGLAISNMLGIKLGMKCLGTFIMVLMRLNNNG